MIVADQINKCLDPNESQAVLTDISIWEDRASPLVWEGIESLTALDPC